MPLSSAYGPVSLLLVQLFLLFSFPLPLPVSLMRFRDLESCLNSYLSACLYEALVWLASTFVQGSRPGEDQGPRRSGRQRAALISTVLSSYYRVWNRFFLNDNDQTRERKRDRPFPLLILRSRSNLETIFHDDCVRTSLFSSPTPLDLSSAYLWTVPPFFPRGTVRRRSIKPAENACACNPICKYFHGSTPLNRGD